MKNINTYTQEEITKLKKTLLIRQLTTWVFLTIAITLGGAAFVHALGSALGNSTIISTPYEDFIGLALILAFVSAIMELIALNNYLKTAEKKFKLFLKCVLFSIAIGFSTLQTLGVLILLVISKL